LRYCNYAAVSRPLSQLGWHTLAEIRYVCGTVKLALGRFADAKVDLDDAYATWKEKADIRSLAAADRALASWHHTVGDLWAAKKHIELAISMAAAYRRTSHHRVRFQRDFVQGDVRADQYARALLDAGHIELGLNRREAAARHYQQALEATSAPDDAKRDAIREHIEALRSLAHLAALQQASGDRLDYLVRAIHLVERTGFKGLEAAVLVDMGEAAIALGRLEEAERHLTKAHSLHSATNHRIDILYSTAALARLAMRTDLPKARRHVQFLEERLSTLGLLSDGWRFLLASAELHERDGRLEEALRVLGEAARQIESLRTRLPTEDLRTLFVADKQVVYEELARIALRLGRSQEVYDTIERAKGRAFLDLLTQRAATVRRKVEDAREEEYLRLDEVAQQLEAELATLQSRAAQHEGVLGIAEEKSRRLRDAVAARDQAAARLVQDNQRLLTLSARPVALQDVQGRLPEGTALLNYFVGKRITLVAVVDRREVRAMELPKVQARDVLALAKLLGDLDTPEWEAQGRAVYDALIAPAEALVAGKARLIIVPHGALHYLPFHALPSPGGRTLLHDVAVSYLPSASVLRHLPKAQRRARGVLAVVNPEVPGLPSLPGAEVEVRGISSLLPARLLARAQATKPRVTNEVGRHPIVHFASHAELDARRPMASSLRLTPTGDDDGRLTVDEIYNLELQADLVVLSACATGVTSALTGEAVSPGDEVVGFSRGLLYAGARSLVATLWPVDDDATAAIVIEFYREVQRGVPKAEALRRAQLHAIDGMIPTPGGTTRGVQLSPRHSGATRHPFFWAAFVLIGDGD
jgi:CHAT domain-containing protein